MLWALVPVKETTNSKQRLAKVLDPREREGLVLAMLQDVLTAIHEVDEFDGVLLVSRSQKAQAVARDLVSDFFVESAGSDHSRAVTEGNQYLVDRYGADSSLAISGDVPRVAPNDIRQVIERHERVVLAPNASGEGTNAVLTLPPNAITCQFGGSSLQRHVRSVEAAGLTACIVHNANLGHDIDDASDLARAVADLPPSYSRDYLESSGIAARLNDRQTRQANAVSGTASTVNQWA